MKKTFIHHDGALGDLLLSLPAISLIRKDSGFVHLAGRADVVVLLLEAGMIDGASPVGSSGYASLYGDSVAPELRDFLEGFDSSVVFTTIEKSAVPISIASVIPDTRVIITIPSDGIRTHVTDFRLVQLGVRRSEPPPLIQLPPKRMDDAREYLLNTGYDFSRPLITVHPGSGGRRKCWPLNSYLSLISMLCKRCDPFIILFSGPAEDESVIESLEKFARGNPARSAHMNNRDLALVAAVISMAHLHIGNDSGISHLAGLLASRSIVIFGPSDSLLWKPVGEKVCVVRSEEECSPCNDECSRRCPERKCMDGISPERVFAVAKRFFSGDGSGGPV